LHPERPCGKPTCTACSQPRNCSANCDPQCKAKRGRESNTCGYLPEVPDLTDRGQASGSARFGKPREARKDEWDKWKKCSLQLQARKDRCSHKRNQRQHESRGSESEGSHSHTESSVHVKLLFNGRGQRWLKGPMEHNLQLTNSPIADLPRERICRIPPLPANSRYT